MRDAVRPRRLGRWLRRHGLIITAALGGATGVAVAAWPEAPTTRPAAIVEARAPVTVAEPVRDAVVDTVQIALLLDTSSSMNGLINQARAHLWNMVDELSGMTRVVDGKIRGVRIELALYEYGNQTLPERDGYIRQVMPFTTDLDSVSEALQGLFTNGGDEFAGKAIHQAVTSLAWSTNPDALRFVFVAGNESFDQGPITAAVAMQEAARGDISVQLIHCGSGDATWEAAAVLARSDLVSIDQNQVAQHIPAPQDADILRLGAQLNDTYVAYGAHGQQAAARQASADASSARMSAKVAVERSQLKAKRGYKNEMWDLVDALEKDAAFLDKVADPDLPSELRGKSLAEKKAAVAAKAATRAELKARIVELEAERTRFLARERERLGAAEDQSLNAGLMTPTKKAATKKGYSFRVP
jgi:hypothetical protein